MEIRENGSITHDGIAVGSIDITPAGPDGKHEQDTLTIDLGWTKAAGLRVVVRDDPAIDHHRRGIFLDR